MFKPFWLLGYCGSINLSNSAHEMIKSSPLHPLNSRRAIEQVSSPTAGDQPDACRSTRLNSENRKSHGHCSFHLSTWPLACSGCRFLGGVAARFVMRTNPAGILGIAGAWPTRTGDARTDVSVTAAVLLGACLADDMGPGKTVPVIALLLHLKKEAEATRKASLLVVPASLIANWNSKRGAAPRSVPWWNFCKGGSRPVSCPS